MPEDSSKESAMDLSLLGQAPSCKLSDGRAKLRSWLNKQMRIEMSDGRILLGIFLCTDRDGNVILGSCTEYINPEAWGFSDEPRMLGLVMVPGKHIVRVWHDAYTQGLTNNDTQRPSSTDQSVDVKLCDLPSLVKSVTVTPLSDPIEWSQNPLWDPNLSDSPDSECPQRPGKDKQQRPSSDSQTTSEQTSAPDPPQAS